MKLTSSFKTDTGQPRLYQSGLIGLATGGMIGGAICIAVSIYIERFVLPGITIPNEPVLSYGQEFGLIFFPFCIFIGALTGAVIGASLCPTWEPASILLVTIVIASSMMLCGTVESLVEFFQAKTAVERSIDRGSVVMQGALAATLLAAVLSAATMLTVCLCRMIRRVRAVNQKPLC